MDKCLCGNYCITRYRKRCIVCHRKVCGMVSIKKEKTVYCIDCYVDRFLNPSSKYFDTEIFNIGVIENDISTKNQA